MLDVLTQIVADRAIGQIFFGDAQIMEVELLGAAAREAIEQDATAERQAFLPTVAPYSTIQWPWQTGTSAGDASQPGD